MFSTANRGAQDHCDSGEREGEHNRNKEGPRKSGPLKKGHLGSHSIALSMQNGL